MNWLIVVESDLSRHFAMYTHVLELTQALAKYVDLTLVTYTPSSNLASNSSFPSIFYKPAHFLPRNLAQIYNSWRFYAWIKRYLRSHRVEVIYQRATAYSLGALLAARSAQIPTILEINGAWTDEQHLSTQYLSVWRKIYILPILWLRGKSLDFACRLTGHIVVVTPQLVDYLIRRGILKSKITPVSNGVNSHHFFPLDKLESRQKLGLGLNSTIIGFIGSLTAWQGLDLLIQSFARLCPTLPDLHLLIVGDGSEQPSLRKLTKKLSINNRVSFCGAQPYDTIPEFIASCDLMVAPKRPLVSGYSTLKIFEYMACARPVVASRLQGIEIVENAEAGLLFTPEDVEDLAEKLLQLVMMSPSDREKMGQNGRKVVEDLYSWDTTAQRIISIIQP